MEPRTSKAPRHGQPTNYSATKSTAISLQTLPSAFSGSLTCRIVASRMDWVLAGRSRVWCGTSERRSRPSKTHTGHDPANNQTPATPWHSKSRRGCRVDGKSIQDTVPYRPPQNRVQIAEPERSLDHESHYATLFHELIHSTSRTSRLDRGLERDPSPSGSPDCSKEELVAEMRAAFLAAKSWINPATVEQSAA